jgi:hypothetical protein
VLGMRHTVREDFAAHAPRQDVMERLMTWKDRYARFKLDFSR